MILFSNYPCALLSSKPFIISSLNEIILLKIRPTPKEKEKYFPKKKIYRQ